MKGGERIMNENFWGIHSETVKASVSIGAVAGNCRKAARAEPHQVCANAKFGPREGLPLVLP